MLKPVRSMAVLLICAALLAQPGSLFLAASAAPLTAIAPNLGTARSFAVLGASTVTNTAASVVQGNLGVSPGTSVTGFPPGVVNGTIYAGNAVAAQAQTDTTTAYNALASQACDTTYAGSKDLTGLVLLPGVYCAGDFALTGTLTLSGGAADVWIFRSASTLITGSGAQVNLTGGAVSCNVWWQVGSSATLGTGTAFRGNILAVASITLNTKATLSGAALARNGAVTMDKNTVSSCFGPNAVTIQKFQASSMAPGVDVPAATGAVAALMLSLGLIVLVRRRTVAPTAGELRAQHEKHQE